MRPPAFLVSLVIVSVLPRLGFSAGPDDVPFPVVFFPPAPPVYGAPIAERVRAPRQFYQGHRLVPPEGVAEFTADLIYPSLATRLYADKLSRQLEARIDQYRSRRNALINALLDQCLLLHGADADTRELEFRAFAAIQSPLISALETEADALRQELTMGLLGLNTGWNARRRWKLDSLPPGKDWMQREAEFQIIRAAAYYDDGLSPAQRGLLRESALELDHLARLSRGDASGRRDSEAMFFSPETTRLRLPAGLPPSLSSRIASYNREKLALKQELRELVVQLEGASQFERGAAFTKLADEQWPRLAELELRAEELRGDLAPYFVPAAPAKPPLPESLLTAIQSYNDDRDAYYGDLRQAMLDAARAIEPPDRNNDPDEKFRLNDEFANRRKEAAHNAMLKFQADTAERFANLEARHKAIRTALESIAKTTPDPETGRMLNVDGLLRVHAMTMAKFDEYGRTSTMYLHYRTAMLQRGLSPEQRRLLFSHAVAALAQALPPGEPIPQRGMKYPVLRPSG